MSWSVESWSVEIFVDHAHSLAALATDIEKLLGIRLEACQDDLGPTYRYSGRGFTLTLFGDHQMVNDRDMNFEDYAYEISLWLRNTENRTEAQAATLRFARSMFAKLKETGRYSLLFVENMQNKLASFNRVGGPPFGNRFD